MNTVLVVEWSVGALLRHIIERYFSKLLTIFVTQKATSKDTTAHFCAEIPKKVNLTPCFSEIIVFLHPH
jgi:hypothetical protein